jgi:feruloyl esterase
LAASTCYTASNLGHLFAGRAYNFWGFALALGSNQYMGLANSYTTTTLKKTGSFSYVIGTCN